MSDTTTDDLLERLRNPDNDEHYTFAETFVLANEAADALAEARAERDALTEILYYVIEPVIRPFEPEFEGWNGVVWCGCGEADHHGEDAAFSVTTRQIELLERLIESGELNRGEAPDE